MSPDTVVLDVDGTLVDSVYQHTMAWDAAFAEVGVTVPIWRIHRAIGMGGDRLVAEVAGHDVETTYGDQVRDLHGKRFADVIDNVRPFDGAARLLAGLRHRSLRVVLASSGEPEQTERLLSKVEGADRVDARTSSGDVDESKPAPDLIEVALAKVGASHAVVVGDAVWDVAAAKRAGLPSIGLLCGGFGEQELLGAGADQVFASPGNLADHLGETLLRGR